VSQNFLAVRCGTLGSRRSWRRRVAVLSAHLQTDFSPASVGRAGRSPWPGAGCALHRPARQRPLSPRLRVEFLSPDVGARREELL